MLEDDARDLVTDQHVLGLRVMQLMMTAGACLFLVVVVGMHALGHGGEAPVNETQTSLLGTLSMVHAGLALAAWTVAILLPRLLLGQDGAARRDARVLVLRMRSLTVMRIAALEGAALMGVTVCLLAVMNGAVDAQPLWWLNALSVPVLLVVSVMTLPTRQRLLERLEHSTRR